MFLHSFILNGKQGKISKDTVVERVQQLNSEGFSLHNELKNDKTGQDGEESQEGEASQNENDLESLSRMVRELILIPQGWKIREGIRRIPPGGMCRGLNPS